MTKRPDAAPTRAAAATAAPIEHRVLIVEKSTDWSGKFHKVLEKTGIEDEIVTDADSAMERLAQEGDDVEPITSVITDGLAGKWIDVAGAAMEVGATPVLVTRSSLPSESAEAMGIPVFVKNRLEASSVVFERLMKAVVPPPPER